jgi:hypothetical protein
MNQVQQLLWVDKANWSSDVRLERNVVEVVCGRWSGDGMESRWLRRVLRIICLLVRTGMR